MATIRTLRFHGYGEPAAVLHLETTEAPTPAPNRIRVAVKACGLNPADWALCGGLFPGKLPRGVGLEVAGVVDALGEGVVDVAIGDRVFGTPDWAAAPIAGASDCAIMDHWAKMPAELGFDEAAVLPMAVSTAYLHLVDALKIEAGQRIVVHGAGTTVGFAAVQIALARGCEVIATAGPTYAEKLRALGAKVTAYGDGMVDRVKALTGGPVAFVLDTAPPSGALPDLIAIAGEPRRVMTITDFAAAKELGTRFTFGEAGVGPRYDMLAEFAERAAERKFTIPIAQTFPLDRWREGMELSMSGKARGKLLLLP